MTDDDLESLARKVADKIKPVPKPADPAPPIDWHKVIQSLIGVAVLALSSIAAHYGFVVQGTADQAAANAATAARQSEENSAQIKDVHRQVSRVAGNVADRVPPSKE